MSVSSRAIVFAGSLMLIENPLLLRSDVGFQLSFLAVLGIIYLMPVFQDLLKKISNSKNFSSLRDVISMTLAAQIFTLPLLVYNFGYISLVSLVVNVLIVPMLSFIMIFGFIFSISGIIWQPLGWVLSFPSWLFLTYLVKVVDFFFQAPYLVFEISWIWLVIFYLILGYISRQLNKRQKFKFLDY